LPSLPPEPRVSIVIPALNEERYIGACLESVAAQDYPAGLIEVVVADGGSSDHTRDIVTAFAARSGVRTELVDNPARATAHGLNAGVARARGDVIIILGAHASIPPTFVSANVAALRETGAAASGGPIETVGEGDVADAIAAAVSHPFGVGDARFRYASTAGFVDTIAFAAYRRECFDAIGGFDTNRDKAEDDFFNYEVRKAGGRLYLTPTVWSTYYARSTFPSLARQYLGYGRAKGRAMVAAPGSLQPRHLAPAAMVVAGGCLGVMAPRWPATRWMLAACAAVYAVAASLAAQRATARRNRPRLAPLTFAAFPVVHFAYGLGTLRGAIESLLRR
jgi:glycosyltransferase involved in cell wall biosynthesis